MFAQACHLSAAGRSLTFLTLLSTSNTSMLRCFFCVLVMILTCRCTSSAATLSCALDPLHITYAACGIQAQQGTLCLRGLQCLRYWLHLCYCDVASPMDVRCVTTNCPAAC